MYRPAADERAPWEALARTKAGESFIAKASAVLAEPLKPTSDELFLEFSKNGNRTLWQDVNFKRRARIGVFAFAECLEGEGRFLKPLEETVFSVCEERTWVMPAHDVELRNLHGEAKDIDLASSDLAATLAVVESVLGERLSPSIRVLIRDNVEGRVLSPFKEMASGSRKANWWLTGDNNWNSVCLCNVAAAGLQFAKSPEERRFYIDKPSELVRHFLSGFPKDGFCKEGVGYWNYGFGHFATLSELLRRASGGSVDPLLWPEAQAPALFGFQCEIAGGANLSFSDCSPEEKPNKRLLGILSRRLSLGFPELEASLKEPSPGQGLLLNMLLCFPEDAAPVKGSSPIQSGQRTWFSDWGVLICRSSKGYKGDFGAAIKGGDNNEPHNHDDLGSFIVAKGGVELLCDPGGEVYTRRTFSKDRYESKVLNSFGHSVPRINGKLQRTGAVAKAEILETSFSDEADSLRLGLKSAYDDPSLLKLERRFVFKRAEPCSVEVRDDFEFSSPGSFEEAIVVFGEVEELPDGRLKISFKGHSAIAKLESDCGPFALVKERIDEDTLGKTKPLRVGFQPKAKASKGYVSLTFESFE